MTSYDVDTVCYTRTWILFATHAPCSSRKTPPGYGSSLHQAFLDRPNGRHMLSYILDGAICSKPPSRAGSAWAARARDVSGKPQRSTEMGLREDPPQVILPRLWEGGLEGKT